jgi:hypothetical protein
MSLNDTCRGYKIVHMKVNMLREPHKRVILQFAGGNASQVAPALWADVDIVPERSEWDAVRAATIGRGVQR